MRAIAVLFVLAFHLFPDTFPGGYVGVDVFFVISGFLITGILLRNAERDGRVGFLAFYERRVRRLLPAASVALALSGLAAFAILPQTRWENTGWEILASAFYVENFYLHFQALDYLAADYAPSPFQHYWSLSIEEQFYIFWPVVIGVIALVTHKGARSARGVYGIAFAVVFASSLALSIILTPTDSGAYFLTWSRAWELALGGLVAAYQPMIRPGPIPSALFRWLGLGAITFSGMTFTTEMSFPGYIALVPTLGAAILLATPHSQRPWDPGFALSLAPMRFFGDISYSLYLWHWPAVVFGTVILGGPFSLIEGLGLAAISIVLAYLSKIGLEDRFRERPAGTGAARSFLVCGIFMLTSLIVAAALILPSLQAQRETARLSLDYGNYPGALVNSDPTIVVPDIPFVPPLQAAQRDNAEAYRSGCHVDQAALEPAPCWYGPRDAEHVVAIAGDSHAAQWIPALRILAEQRGYAIVTFTKSACPFIQTPVMQANSPYPECETWNDNALAAIIALAPDLVVTSKFSNTWVPDYESVNENNERVIAGLVSAWQALGDAGIPVLAIEQTPRFNTIIPDCVAENPDDPDVCGLPLLEATYRYDPMVYAAAQVASATTVNMNRDICGSEFCPPIIGNVLVYRDPHHLTATYARTLGPALASRIVPLVEGIDIDMTMPGTEAGDEDRSELQDMPVADTGLVPGDYPGALARLDARYAGLPTRPVRPLPDRARYDFPDIYRDGCHANARASELVGCRFGAEADTPVVVLAGDTLAAQWAPALRIIAERYGFTLIIHTKSRCPYFDAVTMSAQGADQTCQAWIEALDQAIERLQPDLVITSLASNTLIYGGMGEAGMNTAIAEALERTWSRLGAAGIPVLALSTTPQFGFDVPNCLVEHDQDAFACANPRRIVLNTPDPIAMAADRVDSATHLTLNDLICDPVDCPPVVGNVLVYRDAQHLSLSYVQTLAPALAPSILDILDIAYRDNGDEPQ